MSGLPSPTLYDLLQVRSDATTQEVRSAWRKLAQEHHPDRGGPADPDAMTRINQAYETLSDPDRRARYDQQLLAVRKPRRYGLAAVLHQRAGLLTAVAVSATAVLAAGAWTMLRPGTQKPLPKPAAAVHGKRRRPMRRCR
jgi:curved DNA-binding protein CbpA